MLTKLVQRAESVAESLAPYGANVEYENEYEYEVRAEPELADER
jgi:hypothetical protein